MGVNEAAPRPHTRLQVTDQALAALRLMTMSAPPGDLPPDRASVVHLVVALGIEPEGLAGRLLRERPTAVAALQSAAAAAPPFAPAAVALRWAQDDVRHRPLWTVDLLLAAVEVGGSDLADLLERCGADVAPLRSAQRPRVLPDTPTDAHYSLAETRGFDPAVPRAAMAAERALARTRAVGGGAVTLVLALAVEAATVGDVPLDPDEVDRRWTEALRRREDTTADTPWDAGLEPVLEAAARLGERGCVRPVDLLRAALLVGGRGPAHLLAPTGDDS